jgi:ABC-type tungstate transport system substrate-binding protein
MSEGLATARHFVVAAGALRLRLTMSVVRGVALGLVLLVLALAVNAVVASLQVARSA